MLVLYTCARQSLLAPDAKYVPKKAGKETASALCLQSTTVLMVWCDDAVCPPADPGYTLKSNTNWRGTAETSGGHTNPAGAARICNNDFSCLAWNNYGYYLTKTNLSSTPAVTFYNYNGLCIYWKVPGGYPGLRPVFIHWL
jgi:hypothetical protein